MKLLQVFRKIPAFAPPVPIMRPPANRLAGSFASLPPKMGHGLAVPTLSVQAAMRCPDAPGVHLQPSFKAQHGTADQKALAARIAKLDHKTDFTDLAALAQVYGLKIKVYRHLGKGRFRKPLTVMGPRPSGRLKTVRIGFDGTNYAALSRVRPTLSGNRRAKVSSWAKGRAAIDPSSLYFAIAEAANMPLARRLARAVRIQAMDHLHTIAGVLGLGLSVSSTLDQAFFGSRDQLVKEMRRQVAGEILRPVWGVLCADIMKEDRVKRV